MFGKFTRKDKRTKLEKEIDSVIEDMSIYGAETQEYTAMAENLERLYKAKEKEPKRKVSPDTKAIVAGNLLGIAAILLYEKTDIIRTKALGFVLKGRV